MINGIVIFFTTVVFFIVLDWKELKKSSWFLRSLYVAILLAGFSIIIYLSKSIDPFYPGDWLYKKAAFMLPNK